VAVVWNAPKGAQREMPGELLSASDADVLGLLAAFVGGDEAG
jgi:hypothetical protein